MALRKVAFVLASACAYMVSVQHSSSPCVTACDSVRWTASSPSFHAPEIIDPYSRHFDVLPSIRPVALQQFLRVDKSDATILPLVPLTRSLPRARLQDNPSRIFKQIRSLLVSFSINFDILVFLILFARRVIGATRPWLAAPAELVKAVLLHAAMRLRPELDHHPLAWFDDAVASILLTVVIDYLGGALMAALVSYQERRKLSSLVPRRRRRASPRHRSMWARVVALKYATQHIFAHWASGLVNLDTRLCHLASRLFNMNDWFLRLFILAGVDLGPLHVFYFIYSLRLLLSPLARSLYRRVYPSPPGPKPRRDKKRYKRRSKSKKNAAETASA